MSLSLRDALRSQQARVISFIGSGGKTTAIFLLARQIPPPVIITATSHLGVWQLTKADRHYLIQDTDDLKDLDLVSPYVNLITGEIDGDRTRPVPNEVLQEIQEIVKTHNIHLLIEADGSRQKPLKAWADHEPPIPEFSDTVVQVVGLNSIGRPLTEDLVHRIELFTGKTGVGVGDIISAEALTRFLLHPDNPWSRYPKSARRIILLNQAENAELQSTAHGMARDLLSRFQSVVIASLADERVFAVHEPTAGVILAAGGSTRFGKPKQLLDWHGEPFVRVVAKKALEAGLSPVLVVVGADRLGVEQALHDLKVKIIRNDDWESGQASSIKEGLRFITSKDTAHAGACIFLLADQPHITTSILQALTEKHAEGLFPVIAPMVMDRRANPVLFDETTFNDLLTLEGDVGGRAIFHKHRVEYLPWHDDRLLLDVDTPEQYQRLIEDQTL